MNYSTLADEISLPQYTGMSDGEIAAALNAVSAATRRAVPLASLLAAAALNGAYAAVKATAESTDTPAQVRGVCASVLVLLSGVFQEIDLDDPRVQTSLGTLAQAGVLTAAQMGEIDALADVPGRSRAQEIGLGTVTVEDILAARDWLAAQAAEATRQTVYDRTQERLINMPRMALARLRVMRHDGTPAPEWDEVLSWLR
ncbi:hypothetical protein [Nitrobacter sp.]|uniref:hypothetical protein n=1 Tax=Nitrobacter sp. TaxID=29420 RepID=UPI003220991E